MVDDDSANRDAWVRVLDELRGKLDDDEFRRWFGETTYAGDAGDHLIVWVSSEAVSRHIQIHFLEEIDRALAATGRGNTTIRFVVTGTDEDEDAEE